MTELVATTPGLYPLPDWAKDELSDLKGHQKTDLISGEEGGAIAETYEQVRAELIELQQSAGLDRIGEGQARWDDNLAHPLAVHENVETRGIVRYYDNNNFYREPVVTGELTADGDVAAELAAAAEQTDDLQAVLPGPYTLAELATDEHYGTEAEFLEAVAEFLATEAAEFPAHETLLLAEPSLVTNPPGDGLDAQVSEAVDAVAGAVDSDVVVQPFYGALEEKVYAHLLDADVEAVGFDLVSDHETNVYNAQEYGTTDSVGLGVVDGQNTLVEEPETVRERFDWFDEQVPASTFERAYLTSNTELFYLPVNKATEKLETLATAADLEEVEA
ncbi:5-methyltetrahydropteroyltriglutamate--homocysteine methyltransferase [Halosegnis sp.]|uniref:5-methyltetrahydropteroyltriglutamate-- homocysteine methyltransferase n=1 Tax=Halosegnis sp. TaxID=2864959 RepID=UPI0035D51ED2